MSAIFSTRLECMADLVLHLIPFHVHTIQPRSSPGQHINDTWVQLTIFLLWPHSCLVAAQPTAGWVCQIPGHILTSGTHQDIVLITILCWNTNRTSNCASLFHKNQSIYMGQISSTYLNWNWISCMLSYSVKTWKYLLFKSEIKAYMHSLYHLWFISFCVPSVSSSLSIPSF